jgi:hypothetical protein
MINKQELQSIIGKYYLNDTVQSAAWHIEDNALSIDFQSPHKNMIGRVNHTSFPLDNCVLPVYDTSKLSKLLGVTSGELFLSTEKTHAIHTKLNIADLHYTLNFSLSDLLLIPEVGTATESGEYGVISQLDAESITAIVKAQGALESNNLILSIDRDLDGLEILKMSFGDESNYNNKIDFQVPNTTIIDVPYGTKIPFDSVLIKSILRNNSDATKAIMKINTKGWIKFEFEGENWNSSYFVVRKADI